jgi:hypothetical protein
MVHHQCRPTTSPPLHRLSGPTKGSYNLAALRCIRLCPQVGSFLLQSIMRQAPSTAASALCCQPITTISPSNVSSDENSPSLLFNLDPSCWAPTHRSASHMLIRLAHHQCSAKVYHGPTGAMVHGTINPSHEFFNTKTIPKLWKIPWAFKLDHWALPYLYYRPYFCMNTESIKIFYVFCPI